MPETLQPRALACARCHDVVLHVHDTALGWLPGGAHVCLGVDPPFMLGALFQVGDRVAVVPHQRTAEDGSPIDDLATVTNPHDPTDMVRLSGEPVGFYVRVQRDIAPHLTNEGYHVASLRRVAR